MATRRLHQYVSPAMKAIILAAGTGRRLGKRWGQRPKILLEFAGRSLLQRHLEALRSVGIHDVTIAIGHRAGDVENLIARLAPGKTVRTRVNQRYQCGSMVTLWSVRDVFDSDDDIVLMDGDVLYDQRLLTRLVGSAHPDVFLLDRLIEEGEEPVKLCIRDGQIVDFGKNVEHGYDFFGESVGFFRFSARTCRKMARTIAGYVERGATEEPYEAAIRHHVLGDPPDTFGFEDISGLPWIEIDFPADVVRAEQEILPKLAEASK